MSVWVGGGGVVSPCLCRYKGKSTHHLTTKGDDGCYHVNKKKTPAKNVRQVTPLNTSHTHLTPSFTSRCERAIYS